MSSSKAGRANLIDRADRDRYAGILLIMQDVCARHDLSFCQEMEVMAIKWLAEQEPDWRSRYEHPE